jgi:hypothetical protein
MQKEGASPSSAVERERWQRGQVTVIRDRRAVSDAAIIGTAGRNTSRAAAALRESPRSAII